MLKRLRLMGPVLFRLILLCCISLAIAGLVSPLWGVVIFSWSIALFEYSFMVPANRIGFVGNGGPFTLVQLKVIQECVTLFIFTLFSLLVFQNRFGWNHLASFLCLVGAVYFAFQK